MSLHDGGTANRDPAETYLSRRDQFASERDRVGGRWAVVANVRLAIFAVAAVLVALGAWRGDQRLVVIAAAFIVLFVVLVRYHIVLGRRRDRLAILSAINQEARSRLSRDWGSLPLRHRSAAPPLHPYADDLDLFGRGSLAHLLETWATDQGEATLASWLAQPADPNTVERRQQLIRELAPLVDLRDELLALGRLGNREKPDWSQLFGWAESPSWLSDRMAVVVLSGLSVAALWCSILAAVLGAIEAPIWAIPLCLNIVLVSTIGRRIYVQVSQVTGHTASLRSFAELFSLVLSRSFNSGQGQAIQKTLGARSVPADLRIRSLAWRTACAIPQSALLYFPIQVLTLWDVWLLILLERWKAESGGSVRGWFTALGEFEAACALASLAHAQPSWTYPTIDPERESLNATGLGHPLLSDAHRVANDVTVGPPGTFLLVTGSNMAGKSTLLRAIGLNAVLASAGGPVCATSFSMPDIEVWTSMRVQDSLARGVSHYLAELQRLKQLVDAARGGGSRLVLYLVDEILQGTNMTERRIAARRIIRFLVSNQAIGAVSTHDLTLADSADLGEAARLCHFRETIQGDPPKMTFDYRLRPGIASSSNALRLLDIVGLDLPAESG